MKPSEKTTAHHPWPGFLVSIAAGFFALLTIVPAMPAPRLVPADFRYLGAFRLPEGGERPDTLAYGGNAMTYNPSGNPGGTGNSLPGSLFISGHDRMPYGELPDGSQIAEVTIPQPVRSKDLGSLPRATFVQRLHNVTAGHYPGLDEIPRIGLQYLDVAATGPKIHIAWGQHFEPEQPVGSHGWFDPDLAHPEFTGTWFIRDLSPYSVNDYMLEIPADWADAHANGRYLGTGRYRDGGWSGMGPSLVAYRPWTDDEGTPAEPGTHLGQTTLLLYESSQNTANIERVMDGYQHPDEWAGGAWVTTTTGKSAVLFAGTKATGAKYWYGFVNPKGPELACVYAPVVQEYTACRQADSSPCPPSDLTECPGHNEARGWWSSRYQGQFVLYDPDDLADVAEGRKEPWEPQPYASVDIDEHLHLKAPPWDDDYVGRGQQRGFRVSAVAYDRANDLLYVVEPLVDDGQPVVHVWRVR
jgi:hypothetical protein